MSHKPCHFAKFAIGNCLPMLLLLFVATLSSMAQAQLSGNLSEDEYRKRDIEIKNRAIEVEERKVWTSALATSVPILVALFALIGTIVAAKKTLVANFTAKAAELALQGEGPEEVINRAKLLARLYKNLLPKDFVERVQELEANQIGRIVTQAPWTSELKKEVIELLAEHPDQREQIIADYQSVYGYSFLSDLKAATLKGLKTNAKRNERI
ncbi:MAG: hypothetical protein JST85_02435 [Acidobacteria bacterium]|nr:hypothetical protein [Acidobacteriota bacterium]